MNSLPVVEVLLLECHSKNYILNIGWVSRWILSSRSLMHFFYLEFLLIMLAAKNDKNVQHKNLQS
jgi:hypothetical protein